MESFISLQIQNIIASLRRMSDKKISSGTDVYQVRSGLRMIIFDIVCVPNERL